MSSVCLAEIDIMMTYTSHQNLTVFFKLNSAFHGDFCFLPFTWSNWFVKGLGKKMVKKSPGNHSSVRVVH